MPVLAQLRVPSDSQAAQGAAGRRALALVPLAERTDIALDTMEMAAARLREAGVQFLRATGAATPAFTGALAAAVSGLDVCRPAGREDPGALPGDDLESGA